jgi:hypothetical protein
MRSFKFAVTKSGHKIAMEMMGYRWVRVSLKKAEFLVASGAENVEVCK